MNHTAAPKRADQPRFPGCVPTLVGEGFVLRAHCEQDLPRIVEQCADQLSQRYVPLPSPYGIDNAESFLKEFIQGGWEDDKRFEFAIEIDGKFAGNVGIAERGSGRFEIGWLIHPDSRGQGIATRAARLIMKWVWDTRDAKVILWEADASNIASAKVAHKLGFTEPVVVPSWLPLNGELRDCAMSTLTREQFFPSE